MVVISTGSELVEPGTLYSPGRSSTRGGRAHLCRAGGRRHRLSGRDEPDNPREFRDALEDQGPGDCVITSGGVSVGAYDVVKEVLSRLGTVGFHRVAMQPGMPQGFGTVGPDGTPFFGLPGNPVSAMVSFEVFVRPALRRMLGVEPLHRPVVRARLVGEVRKGPGKRQFARGRLRVEAGSYVVEVFGGHGSHLLADYAGANTLVILRENTTSLDDGDVVECMLLERRGA